MVFFEMKAILSQSLKLKANPYPYFEDQFGSFDIPHLVLCTHCFCALPALLQCLLSTHCHTIEWSTAFRFLPKVCLCELQTEEQKYSVRKLEKKIKSNPAVVNKQFFRQETICAFIGFLSLFIASTNLELRKSCLLTLAKAVLLQPPAKLVPQAFWLEEITARGTLKWNSLGKSNNINQTLFIWSIQKQRLKIAAILLMRAGIQAHLYKFCIKRLSETK